MRFNGADCARGQESGYNVPFRTSIECKVLETMHISIERRKNVRVQRTLQVLLEDEGARSKALEDKYHELLMKRETLANFSRTSSTTMPRTSSAGKGNIGWQGQQWRWHAEERQE